MAETTVYSFPQATGIITPEKTYIDVGNTKALDVLVKPEDIIKEVTYQSSDDGIVNIDSEGNMTAVSEGIVTITATVSNDGESFESKTVVYSYMPATSITAPKKMYIDIGNTKAINAVIEPENIIKKVTYQSSDKDIVQVDSEGNITALSAGIATITSTVFNDNESIVAETTVYSFPQATGIVSPEKIQVNIGETMALNAVVKPKNVIKRLSYESSDEGIATVDGDGNITAVSEGTATITATVYNDDGSLETKTMVHCVIPTNSLDIEDEYIVTRLSDECSIIPTVLPDNATIKSYRWESSNNSVCYVDEDGKLVKNNVGVAILKATSDFSDTISDKITVVVTDDDYVDQDIKCVRTRWSESYALLDDGTIWSFKNISPINMHIAQKFDMKFEGQIDDFAIDEYDYIYILSNGILYKSNIQFSSYMDKENITWSNTLNNVEKIYNCGKSVCVVCNDYVYMVKNGGASQVEGLPSTDIRDVYADYYQPLSDCKADTTYLLVGRDEWSLACDVYVVGYYNGLYYDKATCVLRDISAFHGGYADNFILGDTSLRTFYMNNDSQALRRMSENTYISYYIDESTCELRTHMIEDINDVAEWGEYDHTGIYDVEKVYDTIGESGINGYWSDPVLYYKTTANQLFAWREGDDAPHRIILGVEYDETEPYCDENSFSLNDVVFDESGNVSSSVLLENKLIIDFNTTLSTCSCSLNNGSFYGSVNFEGSKAILDFKAAIENGKLVPGENYLLKVYVKNTQDKEKSINISFTYKPDNGDIEENAIETSTAFLNYLRVSTHEIRGTISEDDGRHIHNFTTETIMPTLESDGKITNTCECGVITETILPKLVERKELTSADYSTMFNNYIQKTGYNPYFRGNAILNRLIDTDVTKWLRITAPESDQKYGFGGNWWGTTNKELINHQIVDYNDFITLGDINEGEILTEAPENTFPFVTEAYILDESGEAQSVISGGKVKFVVKFNRDMDTEKGVNVYFGSAYPYADYEIDGEFTDARTWVGETTLKTVIENGYQFIRVANGRTAADEKGEHLKLYTDWARFGFEIDTTSAMAMMMQGYADNDGIHLEWMQDDYDTLAGYNVYRADSEDGNYVRINKTVIPSDENTYVDTDVEPGKKYYYTFTVVLTDVSSESKPAGKISINAKDTMAPNVYHSPVYTAVTGSKVIISATVSDNIGVQNAKLYYRVKGSEEWKVTDMTSSNDKYTAAIPAAAVTSDGVEYYIAAFDGVNYTYAGGHTSENPYEITVYQAVESNAKGDVDGDGSITVLDALKLLRAIYDESLLTQEEFLRADLNDDGKLSAVEALRILQYANHAISSVLW